MVREQVRRPSSGFLLLSVFLAGLILVGWFFVHQLQTQSPPGLIGSVLLFVLLMLIPPGLIIVQPNEAKVLVLFGRYHGSVKEAGFWFVNPFAIKRRVSSSSGRWETK